MFIEILLDSRDFKFLGRDEVEDPLSDALLEDNIGEVVGGGTNFAGGMNIDIELRNVKVGLHVVRAVLRRLEVAPSTVIRCPEPKEIFLSVYDDVIPRALFQQRPARIKRRWTPKQGDVFVIPLPGNSYAYGRVTPQRHFYEFFSIRTRGKLKISQLEHVPTFRLPTHVDFEDLPWEIIGNIPYQEGYEPQRFRIAYCMVSQHIGRDGFIDEVEQDTAKILSGDEVASIPSLSIAGVGWLVEKLISRLTQIQDIEA